MAIIIETCPKCGHDLQDLVIATNPPIPQKKCFGCGWEWTGEPEQILRVPFGGNSFNYDNLTLNGNTDYECVNGLTTTITTYGGNAVDITKVMDTLTTALKDFEDKLINECVVGAFEQSACVNCSNNPKNGGSGICHCTLPYMQNPTNYAVQDDNTCMANNLEGRVFIVDKKDLDNAPKVSAERIREAVENIRKYKKE